MGISLKRKIIIIGAGSHLNSVMNVNLNANEFEVSGIVDWSNTFDPEEIISGISVIGSANQENNEILDKLKKDHSFFIAIGDNSKREIIFNILKRKHARIVSIVSDTAIVADNFFVSDSTFIGLGVIINSNAVINENSIINSGAIIEHDVIVGFNTHIAPNTVLCGSSRIGNNVLIGAGSVVLPNISIANNIDVGAGSIVTEDLLESYATYFGSPARLRS